MTEDQAQYECQGCGRTITDAPDLSPEPECCGRKMNRSLPVCIKKPTAEQHRLTDEDEACDEGREGQR